MCASSLGNSKCRGQSCLLELPKDFLYARLNQWLSVNLLLDKMLSTISVDGLGVQHIKQSCPFSELFKQKL